MTDVTLYGFSADLILADAIQALGGDCGIGLLYTPRRCCFACRGGGVLRDADGRDTDLDQVFEARIFGPAGELRWLRDSRQAGSGRAVYLSETDRGPGGWDQLTPIERLRVRENHYLLWGQMLSAHTDGSPPRDGWALLSASRIGEVPVPFAGPLQEGQGLRLLAREYLGLAPGEAGERHGNQVVRAECLRGIESYGKPKVSADAKSGHMGEAHKS